MVSLGGIFGGAAGYVSSRLGKGLEGLAALPAQAKGWEQWASRMPGLPGGNRGGSGFPSLPGGAWWGSGSGFPSLAGGGSSGFSGFPSLPSTGGAMAGFGSLQSQAQQAGYAARDLYTPKAPDPLVSNPTNASGGSYGNHEAYRSLIVESAKEFGVDPDALAAMLRIETPNGDPRAVSPAGAQGLAQFMPETWAGFGMGGDPFNAKDAIRAAANYFSHLYKMFGSYDLAAAAYQGGPGAIVNGQARNDVNDGNMTPLEYSQAWRRNYDQIRASAPAMGSMVSIWGGGNAPINQDFGRTDYSDSHSDTYAYGAEYGHTGHTGLDIGLKRGTALYAPGAGTIVIAGTGGYFKDEDYGDDGNSGSRGEIMIQLDNGDQIILGHTSQINVRYGQRVNAGDLVGLSGSANGDHLHLEVRVVDRSLPSGYRIVDPRTYFK